VNDRGAALHLVGVRKQGMVNVIGGMCGVWVVEKIDT
jgi:hypothetical protein